SRAGSPGADGEVEGSTGCRNMIASEIVHGRGLARPWAAIALGVLERRILDRVGDLDADGQPPTASGAQGTELVPSRASREILRKYFAGARARTHIGAGALALGLCRDRRAVPMLIERLGDTSEDQGQGYIALALGMIGQPEGVAPLQELARTAKYRPALLEQVATGLALLGNKLTSVELAELLAQAQGQFAQISYSNALGRIGDDRAVDPLLEMIGRQRLTSSARGFAAAALGQVADESLMPWYTPISTDLNYLARTSTLIAGDGSGLLEIL
ncbi:MAG: HEAT repeat domain-containing protein, partial [Planctomycetota bacterium]